MWCVNFIEKIAATAASATAEKKKNMEKEMNVQRADEDPIYFSHYGIDAVHETLHSEHKTAQQIQIKRNWTFLAPTFSFCLHKAKS